MSSKEKLVKFISIEDFRKVLKAETDPRFKLSYVLAFGSGLRLSEIVGPAKNSNQEIKPLLPENIDIKARQIKVYGKGGKERITVINPIFPIRESMLKLLPLDIPRTTLQERFKRLCKRVLGQNLSFHTLRHGFGNYFMNDKQISPSMIQGFMGHSDLKITGMYSKANPKKSIEKVWEGF